MTETLDIYSKLHSIQTAIKHIEKEGTGPSAQGSYKFLGIEQILPILKPLLDSNGIIVVENVLEHESAFHHAGPAATMKGEPIYDGRVAQVRSWQYIRVSYEFVAVSDGSSVVVTTAGEGFDSQDKGLKKALTAAYKECIVRLFSIITDEPDSDYINGAENAEQPRAPQAKDRGEQMADKARGAIPDEKPVEAASPPPSSETESAGPIEESPDALKTAKARLRAAVSAVTDTGMELDKAGVDSIGLDVTKKVRDKWIQSARDINAIAKAIEGGQLPAGADQGDVWNTPA